MAQYNISVIPGDGIGPEVCAEAISVLETVAALCSLTLKFSTFIAGGAALDSVGVPLPDSTLAGVRDSQALLFGAIGGPKWEQVPHHLKPEAGLLKLRKELGTFANLRPVKVHDELVDASTLKREIVRGTDLVVVRELTGGIYFGTPRGIDGVGPERRGYNTEVYSVFEIERIARVAFDLARSRKRMLCSVDKANVLESSQLWRDTVTAVAASYPDVILSHMYVDNAAMQLVRNPRQFDVIVTGNIFGDILSDEASMLTGSIGMLASASIGGPVGFFEPIHGSAPDIAGTGKANPLATIATAALLLRHGLGLEEPAQLIERAIRKTLAMGGRTADIAGPGERVLNTREMGDLIRRQLKALGQTGARARSP